MHMSIRAYERISHSSGTESLVDSARLQGYASDRCDVRLWSRVEGPARGPLVLLESSTDPCSSGPLSRLQSVASIVQCPPGSANITHRNLLSAGP